MRGDVLVVGGYGVVGRRIAAFLAPDYPGRIVIAGRRLDAAHAAAAALGSGTQARHIDLDSRESVTAALDGVEVVASCADQREPHLLHACAQRGLAYTDITPHLVFRNDVDAVDDQARRSGARILLGAGIAPGISNMMASWLTGHIGAAQSLETTVLLSIGDEFGAGSSGFLTQTLSRRFRIFVKGEDRSVRPFTEPRVVSFSPPIGPQSAYLFPSSDVVSYPKTLGVTTAIGRYALLPKWLGPVASALVRSGLVRALAGHPGRQHGGLIPLLRRLAAGTDLFGVMVTATAATWSASLELTGHHQAEATAASAADFCRALYDDRVGRTGVSFSEQVIDPDAFFERLRMHSLRPTFVHQSSQLPGLSHRPDGRPTTENISR